VDGVEDSQGIVFDLAPDSRRMVITFGGLVDELATVGPASDGPGPAPVFEFARSLASVPLKKVYVRDLAGVWYHRGVAGAGPDVDSVAAHLRELTAEADEVVMIGNSAGGYAALLFGALLGCEAHVFSPQTFIDPALRAAHGDGRWAGQVEDLGGDMDPRYADLLPVLAKSGGSFHIYYALGGIDAVHAERLGELSQVSLHAFESPGHGLVKALRASGWLQSFVDALVTGSEVPAPPEGAPVPRRATSRSADGPGLVSNLGADSPRVIVTFGGRGGGRGALAPELGRYVGGLPRNTIEVRDPAGAFYHRGVPGVGPDVDSVAARLRELTAKADEVVMIGNSAGGYAALLFGALLDGEVHAFSPETLLDSPADARYGDLLPLLDASRGRFHIYYAAGGAGAVHAERLKALPQVTLHPLDNTSDDLLKSLRAGGWMRSFVGALVTRSPVPAPRGE
jgi:acetyl esterase/lipase